MTDFQDKSPTKYIVHQQKDSIDDLINRAIKFAAFYDKTLTPKEVKILASLYNGEFKAVLKEAINDFLAERLKQRGVGKVHLIDNSFEKYNVIEDLMKFHNMSIDEATEFVDDFITKP